MHDGESAPEGIKIRLHPPPASVWSMAATVGLSVRDEYKTVEVMKKVRLDSGHVDYNDYLMQVGPGVIFALFSCRVDGPHWSEVALAVYRHYETEDLRYVFRVDVVNDHAVDLVTNRLYVPDNGLRWPDHEARVWEQATPEFRALLSTPPVRGVAGLVLGGFKGTKRISGVTTWASDGRTRLQMLVALENCS